jgi:hypothetical protein
MSRVRYSLLALSFTVACGGGGQRWRWEFVYERLDGPRLHGRR